jgi:hypothetical protein
MRKIVLAGFALLLAACGQTRSDRAPESEGDRPEGSEAVRVCEGLERSIDLNLRGRMYRKIRDGGWDDGEIENSINQKFDTRMILMFQLMEHHGCALPTEIPSDIIYNAEGAECVEAIGTPNEEAECYPMDWERNKGMTTPRTDDVQRALENSPLGQDSPPRSEAGQ